MVACPYFSVHGLMKHVAVFSKGRQFKVSSTDRHSVEILYHGIFPLWQPVCFGTFQGGKTGTDPRKTLIDFKDFTRPFRILAPVSRKSRNVSGAFRVS